MTTEITTYIFKEFALRTTSFGISPNGVLAGGIFGNEGGNPEMFAGKEPRRVGMLVAGAPGSKPEALNLSSKEFGSGTGVEVAAGGGGLNGWLGIGCGDRSCVGGVGCGVADCLASKAASAPGPSSELRDVCCAG